MIRASRSSTCAQLVSSAMRRTYVMGVTVFLILSACGSDSASGVKWDDYAPGLQARIDGLADCTALQTEFDTADTNNASTKERTGHNNAELMSYIDAHMKDAGCYG